MNVASCRYCGRPWTEGTTCGECRRQRPVYARLVTPFVYGGTIREMILGLKYSGRTDYLPFFARSMVWMLAHRDMLSFDMVVPVPSTFKQFKRRGYNPPGLLVHEIARMLGVPEEHHILVARPGAGQKGKGRAERLESRKQAFFVRPGWMLEGEDVLLVDDVVTTGATVQACAELLKGAGAGKVYVAAVARSDGG